MSGSDRFFASPAWKKVAEAVLTLLGAGAVVMLIEPKAKAAIEIRMAERILIV